MFDAKSLLDQFIGGQNQTGPAGQQRGPFGQGGDLRRLSARPVQAQG